MNIPLKIPLRLLKLRAAKYIYHSFWSAHQPIDSIWSAFCLASSLQCNIDSVYHLNNWSKNCQIILCSCLPKRIVYKRGSFLSITIINCIFLHLHIHSSHFAISYTIMSICKAWSSSRLCLLFVIQLWLVSRLAIITDEKNCWQNDFQRECLHGFFL